MNFLEFDKIAVSYANEPFLKIHKQDITYSIAKLKDGRLFICVIDFRLKMHREVVTRDEANWMFEAYENVMRNIDNKRNLDYIRGRNVLLCAVAGLENLI